MSDRSDTATTVSTRHQRVSRTFVALADTLVADFDIADIPDMLVERATELLAVSAAGVLLLNSTGTLEVLASSAPRAQLVELFAAQTQDGPCVDCLRSGAPATCADVASRLGQALADVATIAILQHRALEQSRRVAGQLQIALDTRVVIEQAKGVLAERGGVSVDEAYTRLRDYARAHNQRLTELARAVTSGTVNLDAIRTDRRR
jgi:hypothetical protein